MRNWWEHRVGIGFRIFLDAGRHGYSRSEAVPADRAAVNHAPVAADTVPVRIVRHRDRPLPGTASGYSAVTLSRPIFTSRVSRPSITSPATSTDTTAITPASAQRISLPAQPAIQT